MCDTIATIYSSVYAGLGNPDEQFLPKQQIATVLYRQLSFRLEGVRQSEQRIAVTKTVNFTLATGSDTVVLTDLATDFAIPLWVERQIINLSNPVWVFVPTVNLSHLQERRATLEPSVAFHGEQAREVKATFSYYGGEIAAPTQTHRCWYSPSINFPELENQIINLPDNLVNMITLDTLYRSLPLCIANASKYVMTMPEVEPQIKGWQALFSSIQEERTQFEREFELWRKGSRGGHRSRRRRDVLRNGGTGRFPWLYQNTAP